MMADLETRRPRRLVAFIAASAIDSVIAGRDVQTWQPRRWATKPALMPLLISSSARPRPVPLTVALTASWAGDVALMRDHDDQWFRAGIASFAAAHLAYAAALLPHARFDPQGRRRAGGVASLSLLSALSLSRDASRTRPDLATPVCAYGLVIGSMAASAAAVPMGRPGSGSLRAGALLFLASDTLIGLMKFTAPAAPRGLESVVMVTYTAGQLLLARGISRLAR